MRTIHKYNITRLRIIEIPLMATILSVGIQGQEIVLWAKVDTDNKITTRKFNTYGTGWDIDDQCADSAVEVYLGTVTSPEGYVWHVFEETYAG